MLRTGRVVVAVLFAAALPAQAATIVSFDSEALFLAATGATPTTAIPSTGAVASPTTLGDLTFSLGPGGTQLFFGMAGGAQWSTLIPGEEIAISATEDLNVDISSPVFAFGFQFHEPNTVSLPDGCNAACVDSMFEVSLLNGVTPVGTVGFNAADAALAFFGVWTDMAFDRVEIREVSGGIDNEYFGQFYTGTTPVPEPATVVLLALGIAGLLGLRRRGAAR